MGADRDIHKPGKAVESV